MAALIDATLPAALDAANAIKKTANAAFREERFAQALDAYAKALETLPWALIDACDDATAKADAMALRGVLLSNRAATYLGRLEGEDAARADQDALRCVSVRPRWWKGYWRHAHALCALKRLPEARDVLDGLLARSQQAAGGLEPALTDAQYKNVVKRRLIWGLVLAESVDAVGEGLKQLRVVCGSGKEGHRAQAEVLRLGDAGHGKGRFRKYQETAVARQQAVIAAAVDIPNRDAEIRGLPPCAGDVSWTTSWSNMGGAYVLIVVGCVSGATLAAEVLDHKPTVDDICRVCYAAVLAPAVLAPAVGEALQTEAVAARAREPSWPLALMLARRMEGEFAVVRDRLMTALPETQITLGTQEDAATWAAEFGTDPEGLNDPNPNPQQNCG